jgi:hypothetical protein
MIHDKDAGTANAQAGGAAAAWNAFLIDLGSPLIPGATKGLEILTAGLNVLGSKALQNPDETLLAEGVAGVGVLFGVLKGLGRLLPAVKLAGLGGAADAAGDIIGGAAFGPAGAGIGAALALETWALDHGYLKGADTPRNPHAPGTPTGQAGDPLHVKIVNQPPMTPSSYMPGTTGSLPGQSVPAPGQVNPAP